MSENNEEIKRWTARRKAAPGCLDFHGAIRFAAHPIEASASVGNEGDLGFRSQRCSAEDVSGAEVSLTGSFPAQSSIRP
jgi:hypothetical protein